MIINYKDKHPQLGQAHFIAQNASFVGNVILKKDAIVLFNSTLRGEEDPVIVDKGSAILDNCFIEGSRIHSHSLVSHGANIHFAEIGQQVLVGIGAILLDGCEVKEGAVIGAGTVVLPGTEVPRNSLFTGVPGKKVKEIKNREKVMKALDEIREKSKYYKREK